MCSLGEHQKSRNWEINYYIIIIIIIIIIITILTANGF
jgi:t-SNARE complex subunit (syntaxin)